MPVRHVQTSRYRLALILRGTVSAALAANLPANPIGGDTYKITVAGDFEGSALIIPAGAYFDVGNYVTWNALSLTWDKIDTTENISDTAYDASSWDGVTRDAPSKNAMRDKIVTMDASIAVVSNEVDNVEAAMGLSATGTWIAHSGTAYMDAATTGKQARELLDTQLLATTTSLGVVSNELDTAEAALGLNANGTLPAFSGTNYLDAKTTHKAALEGLDTQLGSVTASLAVVSGEADNIETAVGLNTNGTFIAHSGTNYMDAATTTKAARELLDTRLKSAVDSLAVVSGEADNIETAMGLNANGTMPAFTGTTYLDAKTTHKAALEGLDAALAANTVSVGVVSGEADNIETAVGLNANGTFIAHSGTNYMDAATTAKGARELLDTRLKSAVDSLAIVSGQAFDAELVALAGLSSSANKVPMFSGSGTATMLDFKDEDNMASNSATAVPSQQSTKAYTNATAIKYSIVFGG